MTAEDTPPAHAHAPDTDAANSHERGQRAERQLTRRVHTDRADAQPSPQEARGGSHEPRRQEHTDRTPDVHAATGGEAAPEAAGLVPGIMAEQGGTVPELSRSEQHEVVKRTAVSALVVHEAVREEGERELGRTALGLAFSALAAGLSMGFSMVGEGLIYADVPNVPWRSLLASFGYTLGFVIVVLGRQQLFTENTLTAILPLLAHPRRETLLRVLRLWAIVLAFNLLGACIFAVIVGHTPIFPPGTQQAFRAIGVASLRGDFGLVVLRGIFAGWLIALMVWLLPGAEGTRLHIILILTYVVALGSFAHIIAGSVDVLYLVSVGATTWATCLGGFIVPTLLGNIIGGVSLVAVLNYAQVAAESLAPRAPNA